MNVFHVAPIPPEEMARAENLPLDELLRRIDAASMRSVAGQTEPEPDKNNNGIGLRTELLFLTSAALATRAGADLDVEAAKFFPDKAHQLEYASNLAEIVGWQDWQLAPAENRLRLDFLPMPERLDGYRRKIDERIQRMENELAGATAAGGELTFSAAADAAQCAVRVCEVARMLARVGDTGRIPDGHTAADLDEKARTFLSEIPSLARRCISIAAETSSVCNHLILQAYDALLLEALLTGRGNEKEIYWEAADYASGGASFQFPTRLKGMRTRFPDDVNLGVRVSHVELRMEA